MSNELNIQHKGNSERSQLRKLIRQKRRSLSIQKQQHAAQMLYQQLSCHPSFADSQKLAFYMAGDGEISPHLLMEKALESGKQCYLPVIKPGKEIALLFALFEPGKSTRTNQYNIEEPDLNLAPTIAPSELDTVFMPLVGFDASCNRLGMGKGFYDRTFSFLAQDRSKGPVLVGLAHECQRVESLEAASWDVPLDMIFTGSSIYQNQQT